MPDGRLHMKLAGGPWSEPDYANCWPVGGQVSGLVTWDADEPVKARTLSAELRWRTEGRGDTDDASAVKVRLVEGMVAAGPQEWPFELTVPVDGPISYEGHLIRIIWEARAYVDVAWARDIEYTVPITILPDYGQAAGATSG